MDSLHSSEMFLGNFLHCLFFQPLSGMCKDGIQPSFILMKQRDLSLHFCSFIFSPDDLDDDEELLKLSKMSVQSRVPQHSYSCRPMDIHTATVGNTPESEPCLGFPRICSTR